MTLDRRCSVTFFRYLSVDELAELIRTACCRFARYRVTVGRDERREWPGLDLLMQCPEHGERRTDLTIWRRAREIRERHIDEHNAELRLLAVRMVEK